MSNVTSFKPRKKDPSVWECGECECQHFFLLDTYEIECRNCRTILRTLFLTDKQPIEKEKQDD